MSGRGSGESSGMMQCPIGHPPGPQPFCPICGRQTIPVAPEASEPPVPPEPPIPPEPGEPPVPPEPPIPPVPPAPGPPPPPPPIVPPTPLEPPTPPLEPPTPPIEPPATPTWQVDDDSPGSAAAKARDLIAQLSGEAPTAAIPTQGTGAPPAPLPPIGEAAPVAPYLPGDTPVPQFPAAETGQPFERTPMAGLGFPTADQPAAEQRVPGPGQWSTPPGSQRPGDVLPSEPEPTEEPRERRSSRLLPLLVALVVLLVGGYLVKTQLLDSSSDDSAAPSAQPTAVRTSAPSVPTTPIPSYTEPGLAAALRDPHFKHGYDAGLARAKAGAIPAGQWESVCRTMAFAQRDQGYPWGQHDQVGCLVALSRG